MRSERARLFVALELPDEALAALLAWRERDVARIGGLRLLAPGSLHVTLCFLGSLPVSETGAVAAACSAAPREPEIALALGAAVWLPRRRPAVLAVSVEDPTGALARAQASLSQALAAGGWYEPEQRPFLPHVTVARVRREERIRALDLVPPARVRFTGSAVTVFRSWPAPGGSRYEALGPPEQPVEPRP
jgi:2'-5' RNA ligase